MITLEFFADYCVLQSVTRRLQSAGHEVIELRQCLPTYAPHSRVIEETQQLGAILLSLNGDFADIVTYPPSDYWSLEAEALP